MPKPSDEEIRRRLDEERRKRIAALEAQKAAQKAESARRAAQRAEEAKRARAAEKAARDAERKKGK